MEEILWLTPWLEERCRDWVDEEGRKKGRKKKGKGTRKERKYLPGAGRIMFSLLYGLWKYLFSKAEFHVLILGIDKAGKTVWNLVCLGIYSFGYEWKLSIWSLIHFRGLLKWQCLIEGQFEQVAVRSQCFRGSWGRSRTSDWKMCLRFYYVNAGFRGSHGPFKSVAWTASFRVWTLSLTLLSRLIVRGTISFVNFESKFSCMTQNWSSACLLG